MAISFAIFGVARAAAAQAPQWSTNGPAKTNWAPFPSAPPAASAPSAPAPLPAAPPREELPPLANRVVLFQKPAEVPVTPLPPPNPAPMTTPGVPVTDPLKTKTGPTRDEVFRMAGDDDRHAPILKLAAGTKPAAQSPAATRMATTPPKPVLLEPGFVVHRRLYFEEKNAERYGWSIGMAQPILSSLYFAKDILLWPSNLMSTCRERYSTNAGKFLPGSPVPYYLYPPEVTLVGGTFGAVAIVATVFLIAP